MTAVKKRKSVKKRRKSISLDKKKVTTSYTAAQDKWNTFHHILINYIIDDNFPIAVFSLN